MSTLSIKILYRLNLPVCVCVCVCVCVELTHYILAAVYVQQIICDIPAAYVPNLCAIVMTVLKVNSSLIVLCIMASVC